MIDIKKENEKQDTYTLFENDLAKYYEVTPATQLKYVWKKSKIPLSVWDEVMGFHRMGNRLYNFEIQGRLFYNKKTDEWANVVLPQSGVGLSTKEKENKPENKDVQDVYALYPAPWRSMGTHHNHVNASAFQSGIDEKDEEYQYGVHVTFGKLNQPTFDFHIRVTAGGVNYLNCDMLEWIDTTGWLEHPSIVAFINTIDFSKCVNVTVKTGDVNIQNDSVIGSLLKDTNITMLEFLKQSEANGVDLSAFKRYCLLSIDPFIEETKLKEWSSKIEQRSFQAPTNYVPSGRYSFYDQEGCYGWRQSDSFNGISVSAKQKEYDAAIKNYRGKKKKEASPKEVVSEAMKGVVLKHISSPDDRKAILCIWDTIIVPCEYNFDDVSYYFELAMSNQAFTKDSIDEVRLICSFKEAVASTRCPYARVSDYSKIIGGLRMVNETIQEGYLRVGESVIKKYVEATGAPILVS